MNSLICFLDSTDRTAGISTLATYRFNRTLKNIKEVALVNVEIPLSFYTVVGSVTGGNGTLVISDQDGGVSEQDATVAAGDYSGSTLATATQARLDAIGEDYTVSYSSATGKFTITNDGGDTATIHDDEGQSNLLTLLGFDRGTNITIASSASVTSDFVTPMNNWINITDSTGSGDIIIPAGNYTGTELASTLQSAINNSSDLDDSDYVVSYDSNTYRFSFTKTDGDSVTVGNASGTPYESPLLTLLGWTLGSGDITFTDTSVESDNISNLSGPTALYIHSDALSRNRRQLYQTNSTGTTNYRANAVFKVPLCSGPGGKEVKTLNMRTDQTLDFRNQELNSVDLQLKFANGGLVDLNGQEWSATLRFTEDNGNVMTRTPGLLEG